MVPITQRRLLGVLCEGVVMQVMQCKEGCCRCTFIRCLVLHNKRMILHLWVM
jgi:hypothetical protein